ncbi:MAG: sodium-dependent transporter [Candidatus Omnitrophica bacterium]|nr:sodium-dependent transporter [Candidatus Omnitrophota bacterium]
MIKTKQRDTWRTRLGVILAVAGSAVGLGNFLRFPVQATANGGGAFMIPYFISLFLFGIPLMWIEWTIGRYGGGFGHGTAPGIFHSLWEKNRFIKYFGIIGIFGPLVIFIYYTYIESWTLGYSFFALTGKYANLGSSQEMRDFLGGYQGLVKNQFFSGLGWAYLFFTITFFLNILVVYYGVSGGIERLSKIAMPLLFCCAILLAVRVLSLGAPDPLRPDWNVRNGLGFLWNPDFSALRSPRVWLAAAGQIFFTLSVGIGVILTYASYLSKNDDVALSGLTSAVTNEFAEVILGASVVIPAAFVFFGPVEIKNIANAGSFDLGFITMPMVLQKIAFSRFFSFLWFFLLFLAGLTSSVSLAQPAIAFLEDEFDIERRKAVKIFAFITFILCQPSIFFLSRGVLNDLDFWGGTFCLVLFGTIETILFAWVFGMERAWTEIHHGADINIPGFYKFIIKYITPSILIAILFSWILGKDGRDTIFLRNIPPTNRIYILSMRILLIIIIVTLAILVKIAWKRRKVVQ